MLAVEIAVTADIYVAGAVGIDFLQIYLDVYGLAGLEGRKIDYADGAVIGIIRRKHRRDAAGISHIQLTIAHGEALRLIAYLHGAIDTEGLAVYPVNRPFRVFRLLRIDGPVFTICGECTVPGTHIYILVIVCKAPRHGHLDGGHFPLVFGLEHLDDTGIVDGDPDFVANGNDVVCHVAKTGALGRVHLLEHTRDVIGIRKAQHIQGGVVGTHLALIEDKKFAESRQAADVHPFAFELGINRRFLREKTFAGGKQRRAKEE
jgi:hypothetical protein